MVLTKWRQFLKAESLCPIFVTQCGGDVWWEQVAVGREACRGRESVTSRATVEPLSVSASGQRLSSAWPSLIRTCCHWGYRFSSSWAHWTLFPPDPALQGHLTRHGADHKMNMSGWVLAHSRAFPRKGWQAASFQRKGIFSAFSCLRLFTSKSPPTRCPRAQKRRWGGLAKGGCFSTGCFFQAEWQEACSWSSTKQGTDSFLGNPQPHHVLCWHRRVWSDPWAPPRKRNDSMARAPHPSPNPQTDLDVEATTRHPSDTYRHPPLRAIDRLPARLVDAPFI